MKGAYSAKRHAKDNASRAHGMQRSMTPMRKHHPTDDARTVVLQRAAASCHSRHPQERVHPDRGVPAMSFRGWKYRWRSVMTKRPGSRTRGASRKAGRSAWRVSLKSTRRDASKGALDTLSWDSACMHVEM